jgi:hypothetical protein
VAAGKVKRTPVDAVDDELDTTSFGGDMWNIESIEYLNSGEGGGAVIFSLEGLSYVCDAASLPKISSKTIRIRLTAAATTAALQRPVITIRNKDDLINQSTSICQINVLFLNIPNYKKKTKKRKNNFF